MRLVVAAAAVAAVVLAALAAGAGGAPARRVVAHAEAQALPALARLERDRRLFLRLAKRGVADARRLWWNGGYPWYNDDLEGTQHWPLARLWTAYPLFEALNAIAIAEPTQANRAAVAAFAAKARKYWNPNLKPHGGFAFYITVHDPTAAAYFDDNGWWGIAFLDAYRATLDRAYLDDAARALRFIDEAGWAGDEGGGVWWETEHRYKTIEPLAAGAVIAAELYQATRRKEYARTAQRYIAWANAHSWNAPQRLYARNEQIDTVMNYAVGMMIGAHRSLCDATGRRSLCAKAERLAEASLDAFPVDADWAPQYDAIYLRWLLDLYDHDGDARWYAVVYRNARRAIANARDAHGVFLRDWAGAEVRPPGLLRTHAATLSLLAWLAVSKPPGASARLR